MTLQRELVQDITAQPPFVSDHLCADKLTERLHVKTRLYRWRQWVRSNKRRIHRHARHALHATCNHQILYTSHHCLSAKMQRLLRGAALAVDGDGRHLL